MRIISGSLKGRRLEFPDYIRPTTNLVRKAIFDVLSTAVRDSSVLELFAGSGAVGIEALSYGAKSVTFVDADSRCLEVVEANLKLLGISLSQYRIYRMDSLKAVDFLCKKGAKYDLIFIDPPYSKGLAKNSLLKLNECDILHHLGMAVFEHNRKEELPAVHGGFILYKRKVYGSTAVSFYNKQ